MFGQNKTVCIAGKNQCSIDFVKYIKTKIPKKNILIIPNKSDKGLDNWQPSLRKFAKGNDKFLLMLFYLLKDPSLVTYNIDGRVYKLTESNLKLFKAELHI